MAKTTTKKTSNFAIWQEKYVLESRVESNQILKGMFSIFNDFSGFETEHVSCFMKHV
jgi:hypothetical protein